MSPWFPPEDWSRPKMSSVNLPPQIYLTRRVPWTRDVWLKVTWISVTGAQYTVIQRPSSCITLDIYKAKVQPQLPTVHCQTLTIQVHEKDGPLGSQLSTMADVNHDISWFLQCTSRTLTIRETRVFQVNDHQTGTKPKVYHWYARKQWFLSFWDMDLPTVKAPRRCGQCSVPNPQAG